jgi:2-oxoglutarate dehydrogenase E1 component
VATNVNLPFCFDSKPLLSCNNPSVADNPPKSGSESADSFNDGFVQTMYENYLSNPSSVSDEWRAIFAQRKGGTNGGTKPTAPAASAPASTADALPTEAQPMRGIAAAIVKNMNESLTVPTATTFRDVRVDTLEQQRKQLNAELKQQGRKLSFTHLVAWALIESLREFPVMGHTFAEVDGKPHRVANSQVNFGLAVDVERPDGSHGLLVPVIHDAARLSAQDFFAKYDDLVARARTNKLAMDDLVGTTVTLTNPGGLGTVASVPRLMSNQGTIVATGAIAYPVEFQGASPQQLQQLGVSKIMTLTSTYDHRVIQGAESGAFLRNVDLLLQGEQDFYAHVREALGLSGAAAAKPAAVAPVAESISPAPTGPLPTAPVAAARASEEAVLHESDPSLLAQRELETLSAHERPAFAKVPSAAITTNEEQLASVAGAMALVKAHRTHGHLAAQLDPLGTQPIGDPSLDPATVGLNDEIMRTIPAKVLRVGVEGETLADALPRLREKYCGTIAYEIEHISSHEQRVWLRHMIETGEHRRPLTAEEKVKLLSRLTDVEAFERFVRRAYLTQKQFSIEGVDMLVPMLDEALEMSAVDGSHEVVLGMAHRGRLNVLTHILGRPYESILREFEAEGRLITDTQLPRGGTGDVKYHHGAIGSYVTDTHTLQVTMCSNPSHLEAVDPVVVGRARAVQTDRTTNPSHHDPKKALAVLIHGDAAFPGQGVVAETMNLKALEGYSTGGTLHLITNNQLGFTTTPTEGRSTRYASDLAKGFDIPIIHVNADDPEACLAAVRLAMAFRNRFHEDAVIDLVGYRRHGHNEGDEPSYTQPLMYKIINSHERVRDLFIKQLVSEGVTTDDAAKELYDTRYHRIDSIHEHVQTTGERQPTELDAPVGDYIELDSKAEPNTAVDLDRLGELNEQALRAPDGFNVHPKLQRQLDRRRKAFTDGKVDWGAAESLAYASLLVDGVPIRLSGQDCERGTFGHRNMVLHDVETGLQSIPLQHVTTDQAALEIRNSPLSEAAALGFEYGYGVAAPESLVIWEAQFGDFINGAQVTVDQFIMSGLVKWGLSPRLTLLLPHGYEGSGPEHSNARLDRFLAGAAEGNVRIANCTTAAQFFHLMRRQGLIEKRRPLIVMTPKSLLRAASAVSPIEDLATGRFEWVLDDPNVDDARRKKVTRVVMCSGKFAYDMFAQDVPETTAVVRLELLYPFPRKQVANMLASYPNLQTVVWAQEEPQNIGPYSYILQRLPQVTPEHVEFEYAGRPKRAATSEGYSSAHLIEQQRIARAALGLEPLPE